MPFPLFKLPALFSKKQDNYTINRTDDYTRAVREAIKIKINFIGDRSHKSGRAYLII